MKILLVITILILLGFANAWVAKLLLRCESGCNWWIALCMAWLAGAACGVWSGFFFEYRPSPQLRIQGVPVPVVAFHWEGPPGNEHWVDFVSPAALLFALSNVVLIALLAGPKRGRS